MTADPHLIKRYVVENNNPDFNYEKLEEELVELLEKLIKRRAKKNEEYKPKDAEIQQEIADVLLRIELLIEAENWHHAVKVLTVSKIDKLRGYIESGKYVGTI